MIPHTPSSQHTLALKRRVDCPQSWEGSCQSQCGDTPLRTAGHSFTCEGQG